MFKRKSFSEEPKFEITSNIDFTLNYLWDGKSKSINIDKIKSN